MSATARRFGAGILEDLAARAGRPRAAAAGLIPLDLIDEDPDQPRRHFDGKALAMLADSIRLSGVLQPVGVRAAAEGRYLLRWGARRVRAARLAELTEIPAVLVAAGRDGVAEQAIENAQRVANSNSELAAVVERLTAEGMRNADIATVLALPDPQAVKYYRALGDLAAELRPWIDHAPARALYELHITWAKSGADARQVILDYLAAHEVGDELTVTGARRAIAAATGKAAATFEAVEPAASRLPAPLAPARPRAKADPAPPDPQQAATQDMQAAMDEPWFREAQDLAARAAALLHRHGISGTLHVPFGRLIVTDK